ncbi:MAG: nuclease A inhibitor family protein, partial [Ferruginibacter sp.]
PFEILDWKIKSMEELKQKISSLYPEEPHISTISGSDFFNKIIHNLQISGDEEMLAVADRYKNLQSFIIDNSTEVSVLRCGKIQVGVFIVILTKSSEFIVLKTIAVET